MVQLYFGAGPATPAFIAFGSNLGDGPRNSHDILRESVKSLTEKGLTFANKSLFYRSPAFRKGAGPDYVNAVAEIRTSASATEFLAVLHEVEREFGRERKGRWASRTLDIDLLSFGNAILPDLATYEHWKGLPSEDQATQFPDTLILPHPRIQDRAFVLVPLAEIAPDWQHPVFGQTARELRDALPLVDVENVVPIVSD